MTRKWLTLLVLLLGLCCIGYIVFKVVKGLEDIENDFAEDLPTTFKMPEEDSLLIKKECLKRIRVVQVRNSLVRSEVSMFLVDNRYPLFIYKLDSTGLLSFKDSFTVKSIWTIPTIGVSYNFLVERLYEFRYKTGAVGATSSVVLAIKGDSLLQTLRNDSLINFSGLYDNFSISYGSNKVIDIVIEGRGKGFGIYSVPMDILFCKRKKNTYLLILTADKPHTPIPRNFLLSMLS